MDKPTKAAKWIHQEMIRRTDELENRDLEWLEAEIYQLMPPHTEMYNYPDYETMATVMTISEVLKLVDKMKPVVSPYVAKYLKYHQEEGSTIHQVTNLNSISTKHDFPEVYKNNNQELQDTIAKAYLLGYRTEDLSD